MVDEADPVALDQQLLDAAMHAIDMRSDGAQRLLVASAGSLDDAGVRSFLDWEVNRADFDEWREKRGS